MAGWVARGRIWSHGERRLGYLCCEEEEEAEKEGCRTGSVGAYVQRVIKVKDLQFSPGPPTASHPFRNYRE